jgi:uncharacterized protein YbcI
MSQERSVEERPAAQSPLANVSRRIVQLHKEYYGKGPTQAKTFYRGELVVVLLRGGFTKAEETLLEGGRADAVIRQRTEFQLVMRERFQQVVEEELGRTVLAFMSASHQHPDMMAEVFVLEPADTVPDESITLEDFPAEGD